MGIILTLGVGSAGINFCGPLQVSTLTMMLTLGLTRALNHRATVFFTSQCRKAQVMFEKNLSVHNIFVVAKAPRNKHDCTAEPDSSGY